MQCGSCSAPVGANQKFCRNCGASTEGLALTAQTPAEPAAAACPSCGHPAAAGARFCRRCGDALPPVAGDATAPSARPRSAAPPPPVSTPPPSSMPAYATTSTPAPRPAPPAESSAIDPAPRRSFNWKLAVGLAGILALIGGGAAAYVMSNADDNSATNASARTEAPANAPAATDPPERVSSQPAADTTTTATVATTTVDTTEDRPSKDTRATAPENTMRRHLQALVDQDYAAAFAEFSAGPGGSSEAAWTATAQEYDASVAIGFVDEISRDETGARVKVSFYTHDSGDAPGATGPDRCAWFHGTAHVVNQGGRWLYEPQSEGRTELRKTFISGSDQRCSKLLG